MMNKLRITLWKISTRIGWENWVIIKRYPYCQFAFKDGFLYGLIIGFIIGILTEIILGK
jgi:thiamine transporter ThiT